MSWPQLDWKYCVACSSSWCEAAACHCNTNSRGCKVDYLRSKDTTEGWSLLVQETGVSPLVNTLRSVSGTYILLGNLSVWKQLRDEHKLTHVFGLIIVQNAFELASFFWFWVSFLSSLSLQTNYVYVVRGLACDHFKVIITHPLTLLQWQFGYDSCFIKNHLLVYCRLILGYASQNTTY
jgi:hypothetical protein